MTANIPFDREAFFTALIRGLGMEPTPWRLEFFRTWAKFENTGAGYNPLATTRTAPDVAVHSNWNDNDGVPVKNYASFDDGVRATLQTLRLSYYTLVLESLRQQKILAGAGDQLRKWGTMGFAAQADSQALKVYAPTRLDRLPVPHAITLGYLAAWPPYYTAERPHLGVDFGCPAGTPVRSPYLNPTTVRAVHRVDANDRPLDGWGNGTLGNIIVLDLTDTRFFAGFAHLSRIDVVPEQVITAGQIIGLSGESGYTDGAHLHLQHTVHDSFSRDAETENPLAGMVTSPGVPPPHTGPWVPDNTDLWGMIQSLNAGVLAGDASILERLARIEAAASGTLPPDIRARLESVETTNGQIMEALVAIRQALGGI